MGIDAAYEVTGDTGSEDSQLWQRLLEKLRPGLQKLASTRGFLGELTMYPGLVSKSRRLVEQLGFGSSLFNTTSRNRRRAPGPRWVEEEEWKAELLVL